MQTAVGLGLSNMDRSVYGFKKADLSATTPSPLGEASRRDDILAPPKLPPLGMLNGNNSFANLLDGWGKQESSRVATTPMQPSVEGNTPVTPVSTTSSSKTLQPNDEKWSQPRKTMEFLTKSNYLSNPVSSPSTTLPERQQSNSTCASYSKRSETSSLGSASSRSSVDEVPAKALQPIDDHSVLPPSDTDFLSHGFQDIKLDLELTPISFAFTPTLSPNTNKPLPRAPSMGAQRNVLAELDSAPTPKRTRYEVDGQQGRSPPQIPTSVLDPTTRPSTSSLELSADKFSPLVSPSRASARPKQKSQKANRDVKKQPITNLSERVVVGILSKLTCLTDLKSAALVNKSFYRHFKKRETVIVESVLQRESSAAWELRQLVKCEQRRNPFQIKAIQRDLNALRALQAFMMIRCSKLCRKGTLAGLAGEDVQKRVEIDNALWKIWTFCKLFGKGTSQDTGIHVQMMWLQGNPIREKDDSSRPIPSGPISRLELENISEMWRCMENLMCGFQGREAEAREAGIFDQCAVGERDDKTETQYLEDWIYDILSVGPKAVLTMISCSFEHAKVLGVTKWTPPRQGRSRRYFLKAALEQVYRDRLVEEARLGAENLAKKLQQRSLESKSASHSRSLSPPVTRLPLTIPKSVLKHSTALAEQRLLRTQPIEIRPDCDPEASLPSDQQNGPTTSPTTNPAAFSSLAMTSKASTRLGATLFPVHHDLHVVKYRPRTSSSETSTEDSIDHDILPRVVDPTDRALSLLVKQLGFQEDLAKQALAMSDDGAGIDVQRAVELLSSDRRLDSRRKDTAASELPGNLPSPLSVLDETREVSEEPYRRGSLLHRSKSNLRGFITRNSPKPGVALSVILDREDEDSAVHHVTQHAMAPAMPIVMSTVSDIRTETRSGYQNLTEFIKYRSSIRSQNSSNNRTSFFRGHRKSSSTGTIDYTEETDAASSSTISPIIPAPSLGGFMAVRPCSQQAYETADDQAIRLSNKSRVTLMRVGTGKQPSRMISLTKPGTIRAGKPSEIFGCTHLI